MLTRQPLVPGLQSGFTSQPPSSLQWEGEPWTGRQGRREGRGQTWVHFKHPKLLSAEEVRTLESSLTCCYLLSLWEHVEWSYLCFCSSLFKSATGSLVRQAYCASGLKNEDSVPRSLWCDREKQTTPVPSGALWALQRVIGAFDRKLLAKALGCERPLSPSRDVREGPFTHSWIENNRLLPGTQQGSAPVGSIRLRGSSFSYIRMAVRFPSRSFGVVFCQNQAVNLELEPEEFSICVSTV